MDECYRSLSRGSHIDDDDDADDSDDVIDDKNDDDNDSVRGWSCRSTKNHLANDVWKNSNTTSLTLLSIH